MMICRCFIILCGTFQSSTGTIGKAKIQLGERYSRRRMNTRDTSTTVLRVKDKTWRYSREYGKKFFVQCLRLAILDLRAYSYLKHCFRRQSKPIWANWKKKTCRESSSSTSSSRFILVMPQV